MKVVRLFLPALLLSACSGVPTVRSSFVTPANSSSWKSGSDEAMRHRSFYEDEHDATPSWMKAVPQTNR